MFLTTIEHENHVWTVDLRAIRDPSGSETLEFSFSRPAADGDPVRLTWRVNGRPLQALSTDGQDLSEELLKEQLRKALAEARSVDAGVVQNGEADNRSP